MTHATPRPWYYIKSSVSIFSNETDDVERIKICDTSTHSKSVQEAQANAALIVHAVNTLDEVRDEIKGLAASLVMYMLAAGDDPAQSKQLQGTQAVLVKLEGRE